MDPLGCHLGVWGLLAVTALALIASLVMNVIYCTTARQKVPRPIYRSVNQMQRNSTASSHHIDVQTILEVINLDFVSPVNQEVDDYPIYGNLIQDNTVESDSCYEAMTPASRPGDETKVAIENQMCYASLDLPVEQKKQRRKKEQQKTNNEKSDTDNDNPPFISHTLTSRPSIYLNSEQINFNEGRKEETIHSDPIIFYGKINTSHSKLSLNDTATALDNASDF